jgi:hypothetical protein
MTKAIRPYVGAIEAKGWSAYEIDIDVGPVTAPLWAQLQTNGPVDQLLDGGTYVLAPQHPPGTRLGDSYIDSVREKVGPCLRIRDPHSDDYPNLTLRFSPHFVVFSRIVMGASRVRLCTPPAPNLQGNFFDKVELDLKTGPHVFARDFDIMSLWEM